MIPCKFKISLCLIVKNEEECLANCLKSFAGSYDELVIVDTGSTDKTKEIAASFDARIFDFKWIDDYAAARQFSFDNATGEVLMWADADDILREGDADKIRLLAEQNKADVILIPYSANGHTIDRERMMLKGSGKWVRTIHERFQANQGAIMGRCKDILITHNRSEIPKKSHERNVLFLEKKVAETPMDLFYLAGEYQRSGKMDEAKNMALAALNLNVPEVERYELLLILALASKDSKERIGYATTAFSLNPQRREALVFLCQQALNERRDADAMAFALTFYALPKPKETIWTLQEPWYGFEGLEQWCLALNRKGYYKETASEKARLRDHKLPNFSLIHATRGRPEKMLECRNIFLERADHPIMIEHIFAVDADDSKEVLNIVRGYSHVLMKPGGGCVAAWNAAAQIATGKVLIQLSDDWIPPQGWDTILLNRLAEKIDEEAVVAISDGIDRGNGEMTKCLCMAIMTKQRYEAQGHMFYSGYKSVFSDNEFTDRAYEDGVVIEARDVIFEHVHPISGLIPMDATYTAQNAPERYRDGEATYLIRRGRKGLKHDYAAFILATKDDFCLQEVCERLIEEGVSNFYFGIPSQYWNGKSNPEESSQEVINIAGKIEGRANTVLHTLDVDKHRSRGRHILQVEAMVRNELLTRMRKDRFEHIVVVDGDELWLPGTLQLLDNYISDNSPTSLITRMIPVAGLPGYPIQGAQDAAMVYLGKGSEFYMCRGSTGPQCMFPRRQILHFSATRKTMDEIIQKHRESGHYTDPEYAFEDWIRNTLPNIKPGMRRAHMFTRWDTWPLVREFTKEEWSIIPDTIKPYLGVPKS